ncbi:Ribosomal RNA small subunit methyltransferase A [Operophtera brumata]|nr:Ribosomal RNA small subunit methyltransferase A [Operophtera brumata]
MWKLTVRLTELIQSSNETDDWDKICSEIAAEFGKFCLDSLKEDVMSYFPCIYVLYAKALEMTLRDFPMIIQLQIFEQMLSDVDFIQAYLATLKVFPNYESDEDTTVKQRQLKKIIEDHPSVEVKMHYYNYFRND